MSCKGWRGGVLGVALGTAGAELVVRHLQRIAGKRPLLHLPHASQGAGEAGLGTGHALLQNSVIGVLDDAHVRLLQRRGLAAAEQEVARDRADRVRDIAPVGVADAAGSVEHKEDIHVNVLAQVLPHSRRRSWDGCTSNLPCADLYLPRPLLGQRAGGFEGITFQWIWTAGEQDIIAGRDSA
eukprot:gene1259-biopygen10802